jgi:hypothetical protein
MGIGYWVLVLVLAIVLGMDNGACSNLLLIVDYAAANANASDASVVLVCWRSCSN